MVMSFSVPMELKENVKILTRKYASLRFEQEPFDCFAGCLFIISGDVKDFNIFNPELNQLLEGRLKQEGKK